MTGVAASLDLLRSLGGLVAEGTSVEAARHVLQAPDPSGVVEALYPNLVLHRVLTNAIANLGGAGADLEEMAISFGAFRSNWPLPALFPGMDRRVDGRVSLSALSATLSDHRRRLDGEMVTLLDQLPHHEFMALGGRALRAAYPAYSVRMQYDVDLFAWDEDMGLRLIEALRGRGYGMHRARVFRTRLGWRADLATARMGPERQELHVDVQVGPSMGAWRVVGPEPRRERAREVRIQDRPVLVPGAEDLLLFAASQQRRRNSLVLRDVNDALVVCSQDRDRIDWDHVCRDAWEFEAAEALDRVISEAERRAGGELAPPEVHRVLRHGPNTRTGAGSPGGSDGVTMPRTARVRMAGDEVLVPAFVVGPGGRRGAAREVRLLVRLAGEGKLRPVREALRYRSGVSLLRLRKRLARSDRPFERLALGWMRRVGRWSGSLCELRKSPKLPDQGFCLGRTAARPRAWPRGLSSADRRTLELLVAALPERADEEHVRIRPAEQGEDEVRHRCAMFYYLFL